MRAHLAIAMLVTLELAAQDLPVIASLTPADGATDVDPSTTELRITFDRDMNTKVGWSICGGGPTFPKVAQIRWADARTLVLQVELAADVHYELPINCAGSSQRLCDTRGNKVAPTGWSFTAGGGAPADVAQRERNTAALDALRALVDTDYSYRDRIVADWTTLMDSQRDAILSAGTDTTWAMRVGRMLAAAQDLHLWIGRDQQSSPTYQAAVAANYDMQAIERAVPGLTQHNPTVWSGRLADGDRTIGYLLVRSLSNSVASDLAAAPQAIAELAPACDAMILDLRPNSGGNEMLAVPIAAWFVSGQHVYAGQIRKDAKTGAWDRYGERTIRGNADGRRFDGPVAVLIGPHCVSSCEAFVLMLRQAERAILIGSPTRGSSGNPVAHELPNGLTVWLPSWRATDAKGRPFEGIGIPPDVEVACRPSDFREHDPVLERALEVLRDR